MTTFIASTDGGTITGSTSNDVIIGKSGDDIINGGAGADILLGGAGNDIIYYDEFDLKVDGGTGYDILIFGGTGQSLNLGLQKTVMNFEQIELAGGGGHSLTFSAADVLRTSDTDSLLIHGSQSSHVNFADSGWAFQGYANGLSKFGNGSAIAYIDSAVDVTGFSHNANLSLANGSVTSLMEDVNPDASNMLVATGTILVSDPNAGQALLLSSVSAQGTPHGTLTLGDGPTSGLSNGSYTYTVSNADAQALSNNTSWTDIFIVTSLDGSQMTLTFETKGADDIITGNDDPNTLYGTMGNDLMSGLGGMDTIHGLAGDDTIFGGAGLDVLYGDDGNDTIYGGDDNDTIFGGSGINMLFGDSGNDVFHIQESGGVIHCGEGNDNVRFGNFLGQHAANFLTVYGDDGYDLYEFFPTSDTGNSFGITFADFTPGYDSIKIHLPFSNAFQFSAQKTSSTSAAISFSSSSGNVELCTLNFVGTSLDNVGTDLLQYLINTHAIEIF